MVLDHSRTARSLVERNCPPDEGLNPGLITHPVVDDNHAPVGRIAGCTPRAPMEKVTTNATGISGF